MALLIKSTTLLPLTLREIPPPVAVMSNRSAAATGRGKIRTTAAASHMIPRSNNRTSCTFRSFTSAPCLNLECPRGGHSACFVCQLLLRANECSGIQGALNSIHLQTALREHQQSL